VPRLPLVLLALSLGLSSALAQDTNTSKDVELRVTLHDGSVHDGRVRFKKTKLEVKKSKTRTFAYREIASLSTIPAPAREALAEKHERSKKRLDEGEDAKAWVRLAKKAQNNGLAEEAEAAFEIARTIDPDNATARNGLGLIKVGEEWVDAVKVLTERRIKVKAKDHDGLLKLARYAIKHDQRESAFEYLCEILREDIFHKDALKLAKPTTDRYVQKTKRLQFPVRGRWRLSPDKTRHHQRKSYAVYALDLNMVNAEAEHYEGKGRKLEDYYAFGAPFYAVADGTVVEVRDGLRDNPIGKLKGMAEKHNGVSIDHGNGELSWYIHAKKNSIVVKQGDSVKSGQLLGEVGNSGGSAIPHLHFTLIAFKRISVPWTSDDYTLIAPDGTPLRVGRCWPREGWILENQGWDPPKDEDEAPEKNEK
jgi:murein DD-endopeptidase MepM/ murein hydrolase activator NlpD